MRSSPPIPALSLSLSLADINNVRRQSVRRPVGRCCGHGALSVPMSVALCRRFKHGRKKAVVFSALSARVHLLALVGQGRAAA